MQHIAFFLLVELIFKVKAKRQRAAQTHKQKARQQKTTQS
jgi:hypothetical protein